MQHTYMCIQCDARSPVKIQNSIDGVFSVNETSHYNTNEFSKTYTSQAQIRRLVDPGRTKRLSVAILAPSQAGKTLLFGPTIGW